MDGMNGIPIGERRQPRESGSSSSSYTTRINQIAPTQVEASAVFRHPPAANLAGTIAKLLFFASHVALTILIVFLAVRGFLSPDPPTYHAAHFYLPLLVSAVSSALAAAGWLVLTLYHPTKVLRANLWLGPTFALGVGVLLLAVGNARSFAFAALSLVLALVLFLYACWVVPRLGHADRVLSAALRAVKPSFKIWKHVAVALAAAIAYSVFWSLGVSGVAARGSRFDVVYVLALWLGLAWTMHVARNVVQVALARAAYAGLAAGDTHAAFSLGSVCLASAVEPAAGAVRGAARAMGTVSGDVDEFLFSCASCGAGVAGRMAACGNAWGFVHVGAHGKGFVRASRDTWELFERQGMVRLIDTDLTGSFCFYSGVAGGGAAALVGGAWALAQHDRHVTGVAVYAFFIGYFINRIATAWPQACVSAFHVAYAENPLNQHLGSELTERIRELSSPD